jgi:integrase
VGSTTSSGPQLGEDTPVEDVTTADVDALRDEMLKRVSHRTAQKNLVILHGVMARAKRKRWINVNPCEDAEKLTITASDEFNILEPEQVHAVARAATDPTMAALFEVAAFTGLRCPGELIALRWERIDFANRIVHVLRNFTRGAETNTKGKRRRSVPLSDQALATVDRLSRREHFTEQDDLVFCTVTGGRLHGDAIRAAFYDALDAAGLGHLRGKDDPIIPYDLRHTFGSLAVRKAPLSDVQAWMGHQHISTTMRYVHYVPQHDNAAKLTAAFAAAQADSAANNFLRYDGVAAADSFGGAATRRKEQSSGRAAVAWSPSHHPHRVMRAYEP